MDTSAHLSPLIFLFLCQILAGFDVTRGSKNDVMLSVILDTFGPVSSDLTNLVCHGLGIVSV